MRRAIVVSHAGGSAVPITGQKPETTIKAAMSGPTMNPMSRPRVNIRMPLSLLWAIRRRRGELSSQRPPPKCILDLRIAGLSV